MSDEAKQSEAKQFVDAWIAAHVRAQGEEPYGDTRQEQQYAIACWRDADAQGIDAHAIEQAVGSLVDYLAAAVARVNGAARGG